MIRLVYSDGTSARMRWTDQHPACSYGLGVLLHPRLSVPFTGADFFTLAAQCGARIECSNQTELRRVAGALGWPLLGLPQDRLVINDG